jgi:protein SCO1
MRGSTGRCVPTSLLLATMLTAACAAHHSGRGLVLKIDSAASTITISHEPIPGYMDAMVMPFTVDDRQQLGDVRPGDRIAFRVSVKSGRTVVDDMRWLSAVPSDRGLTQSPTAPTLVPIGNVVPDFTLTDQYGASVSLGSMRGTVVVVTFVYTRCPLPDYCPRMIANLDALRDRFRAELGTHLSLVAVTFDPQHDTPERMRAYAHQYQADVPGWHFLTGSVQEIGRVCAMFGVEFWPEEGMITHTLQTAVIDREGKLAASVEGKNYTRRQLGDLVAQVLGLAE